MFPSKLNANKNVWPNLYIKKRFERRTAPGNVIAVQGVNNISTAINGFIDNIYLQWTTRP